jgi:hypothetical protein
MIAQAERHLAALRTSSMLTDSYRRMYRPDAAMVRPEKVIRVLKQAQVKFVVMGTHGITGYRGEPRATQDIDLLIRRQDHRKAVEAIRKAYPKLTSREEAVVTRFIDPATGNVVIDLMKPYMDLYKLVFRNTVSVSDRYLIPNLEMALAAKYAAMISPNRALGKKYTDAGDFVEIVQHNHERIDLGKLKKLGEEVYRGGGSELLQYVAAAKEGRTLKI